MTSLQHPYSDPTPTYTNYPQSTKLFPFPFLLTFTFQKIYLCPPLSPYPHEPLPNRQYTNEKEKENTSLCTHDIPTVPIPYTNHNIPILEGLIIHIPVMQSLCHFFQSLLIVCILLSALWILLLVYLGFWCFLIFLVFITVALFLLSDPSCLGTYSNVFLCRAAFILLISICPTSQTCTLQVLC